MTGVLPETYPRKVLGKAWFPLLFVWTCLLCACREAILDTTRTIPTRGTLGEEVYKVIHRDLEHDDTRRAEGFALAKDGFVGAIDHMFPPSELAYTQEFLEKLLPLYDDRTIPETTRLLADVADRLSRDPETLRSLAAIEHRAGYVDLAHQEALIRRIARYPEYRRLSKALLRLALDHDGLDAKGKPDPGESDVFIKLSGLFSKRLRDFEISEDAERNIVLLADFLLREDARLREPAGSLPPPDASLPRVAIVARDPRGVARVRRENGALMPPFADLSPRDGLADIDGLGRFVSTTGTVIDIPPFGAGGATRDPEARAMTPAGQLLYDYVNLDQTMLAGALRDGRTLIEEGVPMSLVRTIDTVLGPRATEGGYDTGESGLIDLAHSVTAAADTPDFPDVLALLRTLIEDHEATTAWVEIETESMLDVTDRYPVGLRPGSTFFDDLMSVVRKILREPGLAEDLLVVLQDPAFSELPQVTSRLLRHKKDRITEDDLQAGTVFTERVDSSLPDTRANQSFQQRLLHVIHDTKGASYEPSFIGIPLGFVFRIDDLAEFYLLSIIGRSEIPSLVASLTGLSERPTPLELALFINRDQRFGNPVGHEGLEVKENDGDALFAATEGGMIEVLRPLVQVFYDHGQMRLVFELFEVLHLHWATARGDYQDRSAAEPRYSKLSGIRSYEPLVADVFENTRVFDAVRKLLQETKTLRVDGRREAHALLLGIARKLFDKDNDLRTRDDKREVFVEGERITPLSPFDLIRAARARIRRTVRGTPTGEADWEQVVSAVHRTLLATERVGAQSGRFKNPRARPVISALLSFVEERARKQDRIGRLSAWLREDLPSAIEETASAPEVPALVDLVHAIEADHELTETLGRLRDVMLDEDDGFPDLLATLGDAVEASKDASIAAHFLRFLGREIDPDRKLVFHLGSLARKTIDLDRDEHVLEVARRALDQSPRGGFMIYGLTSAIRQANRLNPRDNGRPSAEDLAKITSTIARYMTDEEHGLEKFYELVENRFVANRRQEARR